ncbi:hypothetical protein CQA53_09800, partial [Helicobacter didelphidarum]
MVDTKTIKCYVKVTCNNNPIKGIEVSTNNPNIKSSKTDKDGIIELEVDNDRANKVIILNINNDEYTMLTQRCVSTGHQTRKNLFSLKVTQSRANITKLRIYKEELQDDNTTKQIDIYVAQVTLRDSNSTQTNPNQSSNTNNQDSNPPPQIIFLEVNLTQANA